MMWIRLNLVTNGSSANSLLGFVLGAQFNLGRRIVIGLDNGRRDW